MTNENIDNAEIPLTAKQKKAIYDKEYRLKNIDTITTKDKLRNVKNKEKNSARGKVKYVENKDKIKIKQKIYNIENKESVAAQQKAWAINNKDKRKITRRKHRIANPGKSNAITAKRRAAIIKATPPGTDMKPIDALYIECAKISKETGIPHCVDHIIPLRPRAGEPRGSHSLDNLRIITAAENMSKGNRQP